MVAELAAHTSPRLVAGIAPESCTGGGIAAALTELAGSSAWFERGYVTYSNRAKQEMLGVSEQTLARHGAVSREGQCWRWRQARCCAAMQLSVAVSGIAGPGGGTPEKPVRTVWFAWATGGPRWRTAGCFPVIARRYGALRMPRCRVCWSMRGECNRASPVLCAVA